MRTKREGGSGDSVEKRGLWRRPASAMIAVHTTDGRTPPVRLRVLFPARRPFALSKLPSPTVVVDGVACGA